MSEYNQMLIQVSGIVTILVTLIISPFIRSQSKRIGKLEAELKISNKKLDAAHHRSFRSRILTNRLIAFIKSFRVSVFEVVEESYTQKKPVTHQQLQRLKAASDIDATLEDYHRFEHEEDEA